MQTAELTKSRIKWLFLNSNYFWHLKELIV